MSQDQNKADLNWCANRALALYDEGKQDEAISSFLNDVTKYPEIAWVSSMVAMGLLRSSLGSRDKFERAMKGFNV
jgi:TolA-binding protein